MQNVKAKFLFFLQKNIFYGAQKENFITRDCA